MRGQLNKKFLLIVMLLLAASLFSTGITKNYVPGETYFCKMANSIIFELPQNEKYSLQYEKSADWDVKVIDSNLIIYPKKADKRMDVKVCDSKNRFIDLVIESKPGVLPEREVMNVYVDAFPETKQGNWLFDNAIYLQGGLFRSDKNHFNVEGELIVNSKSQKGLMLQGAGKVFYNDSIEKYGISLGGGYEPGKIGLFLFADGLSYEYNEFNQTFHLQVRPTVRLRFKRFSAEVFYAFGIGDQYTGIDAVELSPEGETLGIYNKTLSHFGVNLKTYLFNTLYARVKSTISTGNVYKVECETGFELLVNLYITGNYHFANYGKYPELAMDGFAKQSSFGMGIQYLFGDRTKPNYDLRTRNIVETDYPIVVSYKKVREKDPKENDPGLGDEPVILTVTLSGTPLKGQAPLNVDLTTRVEGGESPYKYRWYFEGQAGESIYGKDKETHTYYKKGIYRVHVEVEDDTGKKATSNTLEIQVCDSDNCCITATAHEGAKIVPSGEILTEPGCDYSFEMSALDGYKIDKVKVDGKNIGAVAEYMFKKVKADHRIEVWAKKADDTKQYRITSIANSGGHNDPEGTILVDEGGSLKVRINPETDYDIKNVKVDGQSIGSVNEYTFSNIEADHVIESFFEVGVFYIEAIQNQGGSIAPAGTTAVQKGDSQTYTISVNQGHEITNLLIDGQAAGPPSGNTYTFNNVNANHSIEPLFGQQTFTINASAEGGGSIVESGAVQVVYGSDKIFHFTADEGWEPTLLNVDGVEIPVPANSEYTFANVTASHSIHITFTKKKFTITVISNAGGTVSPTTCEVEYGDNQAFAINPTVSHNISDVKVDGGSLGPQSAYTFDNITANHTIEAIFVIKTFEIEVITNCGTQCTPGSVTVTYGSNQTFNFCTDCEGRHIADVKIDNVSKGEQAQWNFTNITANHRLELFSEWYYYTITETHQIGGFVTLNGRTNPGSISVRWGEACQCDFSVNSNSGKNIENVTIDGASQGVITSYKFENVTADHTVRLDTEWIYYTIDVSWTGNGRITPGTTRVKHGDSQTFHIIPDTDYRISLLKVDNSEVTKNNRFTFPNVTENHSIYAEFERIPLPKFKVTYGGYTFDWHDSSLSPSYGTGGGGPAMTETIEQGQVFSYTYPEVVKDPTLPIGQQFDIPFQYVLINGVKHYNRHISITITVDTIITAYYYIERDLN